MMFADQDRILSVRLVARRRVTETDAFIRKNKNRWNNWIHSQPISSARSATS